ncbi:Phage integrase [Rivularia sp. IAM M-261]|mgnify:CR=1 FL=1|nr:Phage integrase [Rivularia sp. IAM M-261]
MSNQHIQGSTSTDALHDIFADFEAPATTDGSYLGNMKYKKATQEYLESKFQHELLAVKARLKAAKTKVNLVVQKGSIQLQATLPIKPEDIDKSGNGTKQYKISFGIPANLDGLRTAEEEACELGRLIARKIFVWNEKYLGTKNKTKVRQVVKDFLEDFEERYFLTHKRTMKSEHTFSYYIQDLKRLLGEELLINAQSIREKIYSLKSQPAQHRALKAIRVLLASFDISLELDIKLGKYQHQNERIIPSDAEVEISFTKFEQYTSSRKATIKKQYIHTWKLWRWVYGMLATYGLRPRELFVNPDIEHWLNASDNTWKVDKENKTGARRVFPLYPEWIEKFDLKNPEYLEMLKEVLLDKKTFSQINAVRVCCSSWFRRVGIDFDPYDLRHAWAIRAHLLGIPIKAAADNLGHTVEIHTETYQKWFSEDHRKKAINEALNKKSELVLLQEENKLLKAQIERLKLEVETFRQFYSSYN